APVRPWAGAATTRRVAPGRIQPWRRGQTTGVRIASGASLHHLLARANRQHDARVGPQILRHGGFHLRRRDRAIAREVLREVVGVVREHVVRGELDRALQRRLETGQERGLVRVLRALELLGLGRRRRKPRDLFADLLLQALRIDAGLRGRDDAKLAAERLGAVVRVDVLRDLLVVNEPLVESARLAVREDGGGHVERRLVGREVRRSAPGQVHAGNLYVVRAVDDDLLRDRRRRLV